MPDALPLPALLADLRAKAERAKELRPGEADDDWWAPGLIIAHADARAALRESLSPDVVLRLVSAIEAAGKMAEALDELLEVAALRGDDNLPHPADDPKLWTARMQDAWMYANDASAAWTEGPGGSR